MSTNVSNQVPYLRTTRNFPEDPQALRVEINRSYLDIAQKVNERVIGLFTPNKPTITGEAWFQNTGRRQQSLRQIYEITSNASFNHGLNFQNISFFTVIRGIGFDGTNYYPIPYVNPTAANQIGISVTPTQVVLTPGGGSPALVKGIIILEWLSNA